MPNSAFDDLFGDLPACLFIFWFFLATVPALLCLVGLRSIAHWFVPLPVCLSFVYFNVKLFSKYFIVRSHYVLTGFVYPILRLVGSQLLADVFVQLTVNVLIPGLSYLLQIHPVVSFATLKTMLGLTRFVLTHYVNMKAERVFMFLPWLILAAMINFLKSRGLNISAEGYANMLALWALDLSLPD